MSGLAYWITGGIAGLIGLVGLFVAAASETTALYVTGLVVFVLALVLDFWLVKRWFDRIERREGGHEQASR